MDFRKIKDVYFRKKDLIDVSSGVPSDINILDFKEYVSEHNTEFTVGGVVRTDDNVALGIKVQFPNEIKIHSINETLKFVGIVKKGDICVAQYMPSSGWNNSQND